MKNTSRRNFGKALAAGLASLPTISLANANEDNVGERHASSAADSQKVQDYEKKNQHDTPPTFVIAEGSLIVELDKPLAFVTTTGGKKRYKRPKNTNGHDAELDHIKIVAGSGEMLYRNDKPTGCEIVVELENSLEAKAYGGSELIVEIPESLVLGTTQSGPPRRAHRYVPSQSPIKKIKVKRGNSVLYSVEHEETLSDLAEVRIMVWHKDH